MESICNNLSHIGTVPGFLIISSLGSIKHALGGGERVLQCNFIIYCCQCDCKNNNKRNNRGKHNNKLPHKLYANRSTQQQRAANSIGQLQQPAAVVAAASRESPKLLVVAWLPLLDPQRRCQAFMIVFRCLIYGVWLTNLNSGVLKFL